MTLASLGWDDAWDAAWRAMTPAVPGGTVARVAVAHRGAVEVVDGDGQYWAEPTGKMFHRADDARALPTIETLVGSYRQARSSVIEDDIGGQGRERGFCMPNVPPMYAWRFPGHDAFRGRQAGWASAARGSGRTRSAVATPPISKAMPSSNAAHAAA